MRKDVGRGQDSERTASIRPLFKTKKMQNLNSPNFHGCDYHKHVWNRIVCNARTNLGVLSPRPLNKNRVCYDLFATLMLHPIAIGPITNIASYTSQQIVLQEGEKVSPHRPKNTYGGVCGRWCAQRNSDSGPSIRQVDEVRQCPSQLLSTHVANLVII